MKKNPLIIFCILFAYTSHVAPVSLISAYRNRFQHMSKNEFRWNLECGETYHKPKFSANHMHKRIIGGEDAVHHSWPFLASIRVQVNNVSEHHCGGTIISDRHILTAAHCIIVYFQLKNSLDLSLMDMMGLIKVNVGINDHTRGGRDNGVYGVEDIDFHQGFNYNEWTLDNDLMILKLDRRINFGSPQVNIACLPRHGIDSSKKKVGKNVVAIGWGSYAEDYDHEYHDHVQQAYFKILDSEDSKCNSGMIGANSWDKENVLCAIGRKRVTCFGDSGGPVLELRNGHQWTLVGVISFGNDITHHSTNQKKCNKSMPFYFVNVEKYTDWIKSRIGY